ncbi:Uncharacterised protein [Klebsiella pneumoniae]|nr:Uncharacterised protein [Klebsiella pneumoniae]
MLVLAGQLLQPKVHNLMVVVMHLQELLQYKQHIHLNYLVVVRILTLVMVILIMLIIFPCHYLLEGAFF